MARSKRRSKARSSSRRPERSAPVLKTPGEIDAMAASGALLTACHDAVQAEVTPGITTRALDEIAEQFLRDRGGVPAFKGYHGFPATITTSINDQVVHAIPGDIAVAAGDILSIDAGVILDGWVSDMARTHAIGAVSDEAERLMSATETSLYRGIEACLPGNSVGDIGHAVQAEVEAAGFSVVRSLVGHGVGRAMHEQPQVPNFGSPGGGPRLEPGIVIAIEPMVNAGGPDVVVDKDDGWTVSSTDGSLSAHYEHTVAVTDDGPRILTVAQAAEPVG